QHLRAEEILAVALARGRVFEQAENARDAGTALVLVFLPRRHRERLAEIFLREAQPPAPVRREAAVEALDDERLLRAELRDARARDGQPVGGEDARAEPFVLD